MRTETVKHTLFKITLATVCLLSLQGARVVSAALAVVDMTAKTPEVESLAEREKSGQEIVEIRPEDFRPAFTRNTVIKLNAIVEKSYAVIREFDALSRQLNHSATNRETQTDSLFDVLTEPQMSEVSSLDLRAEAALLDMNEAVKTLKASEEEYNAAVLAGMLTFVKSVATEVGRFHLNSAVKKS